MQAGGGDGVGRKALEGCRGLEGCFARANCNDKATMDPLVGGSEDNDPWLANDPLCSLFS